MLPGVPDLPGRLDVSIHLMRGKDIAMVSRSRAPRWIRIDGGYQISEAIRGTPA